MIVFSFGEAPRPYRLLDEYSKVRKGSYDYRYEIAKDKTCHPSILRRLSKDIHSGVRP